MLLDGIDLTHSGSHCSMITPTGEPLTRAHTPIRRVYSVADKSSCVMAEHRATRAEDGGGFVLLPFAISLRAVSSSGVDPLRL